MRTTLAIDDDVLAIARHQAERERESVGVGVGVGVGKVISALARQGLQRSAALPVVVRNGLPLLPLKPASAMAVTPVTLEWVNRLRDELT